MQNLRHPAHGQSPLALSLLWLNAGVLAAAAVRDGAAGVVPHAALALAAAAVRTPIGYLKRLILAQLKRSPSAPAGQAALQELLIVLMGLPEQTAEIHLLGLG